MGLTYKGAGVDIDEGDSLVERIKPLAKSTRIPEVLDDVGGFAGMCGLPKDIEDPVLVSGTDGVGTKLKLAFELDKHDTIGIDLVAMCVNDIVTSGARPLFFLDYFATGKLSSDRAESVIAGIAQACREVGCALLGGETAEMPGMYAAGEYDLAGFAVGVVSRKRVVSGRGVREGDVILSLAASGLHSNGYSLARKVVEHGQLALSATPSELGGKTLGEALLAPTRLYVRAVRALFDANIPVQAMSHITGGGLPGNLPRVLPEGLGARVRERGDASPLFALLARAGEVDLTEMRRVFNMGTGFVVIVRPEDAARVSEVLRSAGEAPEEMGRIVAVPQDRAFEARVEYAT